MADVSTKGLDSRINRKGESEETQEFCEESSSERERDRERLPGLSEVRMLVG
jgi:hypothetical protein